MKSHKSFLARKTNGHTLRLDGFITLMSLFGGFVPLRFYFSEESNSGCASWVPYNHASYLSLKSKS